MGKFTLGAKRPLIISGPCSAETREQTVETAMKLALSGRVDVIRAGIWKPRTKPGTFEGIGEIGLEWLNEVKQATGLPIAVSAAFVFGDHLGFTAGFAPEMLPGVILGKLVGGVSAVAVALWLTRKK